MKSLTGIAYEWLPKPGKHTIVFSNSLGLDRSMWDQQVKDLRDHFSILRYDTRGHGQSDQISTQFKIDDLGLDVIQLMDDLKIKTAHYCGLSLGGLTGFWLGIHQGHRFESMVFSNTAPKIGSFDIWKNRIQSVNAEGLAKVAESSPPRWFTQDFLKSHPAEVQKAVTGVSSTSPIAYNACCEVLAVTDLWPELSHIQNETLIIGAASDPTTTVDEAKRAAAAIPNAQLEIVPAAHLSNLELKNYSDLLKRFFS